MPSEANIIKVLSMHSHFFIRCHLQRLGVGCRMHRTSTLLYFSIRMLKISFHL